MVCIPIFKMNKSSQHIVPAVNIVQKRMSTIRRVTLLYHVSQVSSLLPCAGRSPRRRSTPPRRSGLRTGRSWGNCSLLPACPPPPPSTCTPEDSIWFGLVFREWKRPHPVEYFELCQMSRIFSWVLPASCVWFLPLCLSSPFVSLRREETGSFVETHESILPFGNILWRRHFAVPSLVQKLFWGRIHKCKGYNLWSLTSSKTSFCHVMSAQICLLIGAIPTI